MKSLSPNYLFHSSPTHKVILLRFERRTYCLEGSCSIQLSYKTFVYWKRFFLKSGWQDSNLRPPAPKAGAITGLRYIPSYPIFFCGEGGIRTPGTLIEYDSLANCWFQPLTHLSVCQTMSNFYQIRFAKVLLFSETTKFFFFFIRLYFFAA